MKKRILSLLLAMLLTVSLLPMSAAAEGSNSVERQIRTYASSINQPDAASKAAKVLAVHGMTQNGKTLVMDENDPLTAALLNSELMQYGMGKIITEAVECMQQLDMPAAPGLNMQFGWYGAQSNYSGYMKANSGKGADSLDWMYCNEPYTGKMNAYDDALEWMVGDCNVDVVINCICDSVTDKTYHVSMDIHDRFDFSLANSAGFKLLMSGFGMMLFREFDWSCKVEFELTIPYSYNHCSHSAGAYHWTLDSERHTMTSDNGGVFTANNTVHNSKTATDGTVHHDYALDHTVRLLHNKPWVLAYEVRKPHRISFEPVDMAVTKTYPCIRHSSTQSMYATTKDYTMAPNPLQGGRLDRYYAFNYYGTKLQPMFTYSPNALYAFRLENQVSSDGSNMIYLTVANVDSGAVYLDRVPMDDYYYYGGWMDSAELRSEANPWLSGKDIFVNYLGSSIFGLDAEYLDIRIWENGINGAEESYFVTENILPTCTEGGGVTHTCSRCGFSHKEDSIPALGHSFGAYVYDNNASCTADGTQTRKCTRCDVTETITAPDTATGHSYDKVVTAPTYTEQGYTTYTCTVCGDSYKDNYTDLKQHSYVGVVTEPTCVAQGYTTYTCTECGDSYVDDYTDVVDHTPVTDPAVPPTCVEKGKMEGSHCGTCGLVLKKQALISTVDTHRMEESIIKMPTYDEPGQVAYICKDCGKTDYLEIPPLNKPERTNPFTDVLESDWFYEPVLWAVENKVTGGKTETTFAPNEGCTRAQVVTFLWAANGKPEPTTENPFTDVSNDAWYLKPVLWAVEQGITTGVTATEFGPDQTCTRAQIATFLWAANGKPAVSGKSEFIDVADGDWYAAPIIWAKENDITGGIGEGKFGPNETCTRAQVVTFMKKVYG